MTHKERLTQAQERTEKARAALQAAKVELYSAMADERAADKELLEHTLRKEMGR